MDLVDKLEIRTRKNNPSMTAVGLKINTFLKIIFENIGNVLRVDLCSKRLKSWR